MSQNNHSYTTYADYVYVVKIRIKREQQIIKPEFAKLLTNVKRKCRILAQR
jgi:hypothetical protein